MARSFSGSALGAGPRSAQHGEVCRCMVSFTPGCSELGSLWSEALEL